jgi:hypothetical protein
LKAVKTSSTTLLSMDGIRRPYSLCASIGSIAWYGPLILSKGATVEDKRPVRQSHHGRVGYACRLLGFLVENFHPKVVISGPCKLICQSPRTSPPLSWDWTGSH